MHLNKCGWQNQLNCIPFLMQIKLSKGEYIHIYIYGNRTKWTLILIFNLHNLITVNKSTHHFHYLGNQPFNGQILKPHIIVNNWAENRENNKQKYFYSPPEWGILVTAVKHLHRYVSHIYLYTKFPHKSLTKKVKLIKVRGTCRKMNRIPRWHD